MAVAALLPAEPELQLSELEVDAIRECLRSIRADERPKLYTLLDGLRSAIASGDLAGMTALAGRAPEGPIRRCLLRVIRPFVTARRRSGEAGAELEQRASTAPPAVRGHYRPGFLGLYRGLAGVVAPVEVWACRGLYWHKVNADAFAGVHTGRRGHEPVGLDWRHHRGTVLGCSRGWGLAPDGSLLGTFDLGSHPAAQAAGRMAERDEVGLSMSVRFRTHWLAQVDPDEWGPDALDVCTRDDAVVEAVALTPAPAFSSARVTRTW